MNIFTFCRQERAMIQQCRMDKFLFGRGDLGMEKGKAEGTRTLNPIYPIHPFSEASAENNFLLSNPNI